MSHRHTTVENPSSSSSFRILSNIKGRLNVTLNLTAHLFVKYKTNISSLFTEITFQVYLQNNGELK